MKTTRVYFDIVNVLGLAVAAGVGFALWSLRDFLIVLLVALVVSTFIEDFVVRAERLKIPRIVSVILFYLLTLFVLIAITVFFIPIMINEMSSLAELYPGFEGVFSITSVATEFTQGVNIQDLTNIFSGGTAPEWMETALGFFGGLVNLVLIFIISFYLSIQKGSFDKLLRIITPLAYEDRVLKIWHRTQIKVGSWFRGQLIIAILLALLTYIGLSILGIPYALLLSLLAGLFGLVPYGIFIAILPAIILGFASGGLKMSIFVVVLYVLLQQILDYVLQPIILKKMTGIPSLLVIVSVITGAKLFGFLGLIVAVPVTLFLLELVDEREKSKAIRRNKRTS
jgi:predicted PurR-regulated permease PerM